MLNKIMKNIVLVLGIIYFIVISYLSYTFEPYSSNNNLVVKITLSVISFILISIIYILLIKPKLITKNEFKTDTYIALYTALIIIPLISLISF